ncbi:superoxide dismutase [Fodinibius halophilus]|nr:superoxide dismutase [Fodinibius halophilus]
MTHQLPTLSFEYDALEPFIDADTMRIHHSKHHQGYVNKFNNAIKGTKYAHQSIGDILTSASVLPTAIRNNGGGHYNHSLFWDILSPNPQEKPQGKLAEAIENAFGSFDSFKQSFADAAGSQFGSGWAWLVVRRDNNKLAISSTPNQDNPLMDTTEIQGTPILGVDVWEHAYYLNYQNKRGDYLDAFWNVVDWEAVAKRYEQASETS